ncbi:MAG: exodeoxyribonuclease VII large subunit [Candidatus Firestonebacteria bacterium]|nr:exodeoxyribonuclease VII large subunit [Candidatus Firestonebacteria bacterium]
MALNAPAGSDRQVLTVTDLVTRAREVLEGMFARVWVQGEISNFKKHSSGHCYFTLKDATGQLRCAMFKMANRGLKFKVADGLQVVAGGRLSVYTARGDFQMIAETLEPAGVGALQLAFEQLKAKLAAEGLFDAARKRPLPEFPQRIAVVTSATGAAIQDILNVTGRRSPLADISLYPVRVQGAGAAEEIARALDRLNAVGGWDVIICGRGGGSLEDLWAFNEEVVARAIAASRIPVISAVGHEIDYTIADFVADVRAETPTAAAEMVVQDRRELLGRVQSLSRVLANALAEQLRSGRQRLDRLMRSAVLQQPRRVFEPLAQRLDDLRTALQQQLSHRLNLGNERLRGLAGALEALSPLKVMGRGYSLVYRLPAGELVREAKRLKIGDELRIRLAQGEVLSRVEKIVEK